MKKLKVIKIQKIYFLFIFSFFIISFFQITIGGSVEPLIKKLLLEPLPRPARNTLKKVCDIDSVSRSSEQSLLKSICLNLH